MASTLIALLLLAIFSCISAQDIACPPGSFLQTDVTTFTVPSSPKSLESTLGDFYSNSWQSLLQTSITFAPAFLSRTLHFTSESLNITETLLPSTPMLLQWQLSSGAFVLPSGGAKSKVLSYNQSLSLLPVCDSDSYTTITWSIHACISSPFEGQDEEGQDEEAQPINWFKLQHDKAARSMFATVSHSWFGPVSTNQENAACPTNDSRAPVLSKLSGTIGALKELSLAPAPTVTAVVSSSVSAPVPTTTFKTSYPLIPLPVTLSLPAENATWSTVGVKGEETPTFTSFIPMATYIPGNGATGRNSVDAVVVMAAIIGWLFV